MDTEEMEPASCGLRGPARASRALLRRAPDGRRRRGAAARPRVPGDDRASAGPAWSACWPTATGPTVLLRADMDALPVLERTGLDYARPNAAPAPTARRRRSCTPAATTCTSPACSARPPSWRRTRAAGSGPCCWCSSPRKRSATGAQAMIDDGLFDRFPGSRRGPRPARRADPGRRCSGVRPGPAFAATDSLRIVLHGQGGHGSRPETTVDPVLMAAAVVLRLQGIVARELPRRRRRRRHRRRAARRDEVRTSSPTRPNCSSRSAPSTRRSRAKVLDGDRPDRHGARRPPPARSRAPEIISLGAFPAVVNDAGRVAPSVTDAFAGRASEPGLVLDPGPVTGSEDVGCSPPRPARPAPTGCSAAPTRPCSPGVAAPRTRPGRSWPALPSNHSPLFAPVPEPTPAGRRRGTDGCRARLAPDGLTRLLSNRPGQPPTYAARCCPVRVERSATSSAGVPSKTIRPPSWPAPGPEVDDPVGVRHHRLVVLDDDHRLAGVDEPVEQPEQLLDVGEVQAGRRLVEDVDVALLRHVRGQLEPLPLAAGQRRERLAEAEVAEPDVGEPVEDRVRGRRARLAVAEELLAPRSPTSRAPR